MVWTRESCIGYTSKERISARIVKQIVDVLLLVVMEETVESIWATSQDRIWQRTIDEIMDALGSQAKERIVEVAKVILRERRQNGSWSRLVIFSCSTFKEDLRR